MHTFPSIEYSLLRTSDILCYPVGILVPGVYEMEAFHYANCARFVELFIL